MDPVRDEHRPVDRLRDAIDRLRPAPAHVAALAVLASCACAGLVVLWLIARPTPIASPPTEPSTAPSMVAGVSPGPSSEPVIVHVSGAVASEGVVELPAGSRVIDAVAAAGGPRRRARTERLNLARVLRDGEQIHVPRPAEGGGAGVGATAGSAPAVGSGGVGGAAAGAGSPTAPIIDLNTASSAELETLPGVGPVLAARIVAHREAGGPFTSVEQLLEVPGIGEKTFAALRDLVVV